MQKPQQQLGEEKKIKQPAALAAASGTWLSKTIKVSPGCSRAVKQNESVVSDWLLGFGASLQIYDPSAVAWEIEYSSVGCRGLTGVCAGGGHVCLLGCSPESSARGEPRDSGVLSWGGRWRWLWDGSTWAQRAWAGAAGSDPPERCLCPKALLAWGWLAPLLAARLLWAGTHSRALESENQICRERCQRVWVAELCVQKPSTEMCVVCSSKAFLQKTGGEKG